MDLVNDRVQNLRCFGSPLFPLAMETSSLVYGFFANGLFAAGSFRQLDHLCSFDPEKATSVAATLSLHSGWWASGASFSFTRNRNYRHAGLLR